MPDERLHACAYHVLRYNPNLVRDEWVNIGILVHDPKSKRARARLIEEPVEFGRVRKLHANADLDSCAPSRLISRHSWTNARRSGTNTSNI